MDDLSAVKSRPDILAIFRAGFVRRWHTNPDLGHTCDRIDGHSARVARIILALHPEPTLSLIRAALIHDDGESVVGDIPYPAKIGRLGTEYRAAEGKAERAIWGDAPMLSGDDLAWLKFADRLDAYMWAAHHAPHVMGRDGWPGAHGAIKQAAADLLDGGSFTDLMSSLDEMVEARHAAS
jgi:hypothetical protein